MSDVSKEEQVLRSADEEVEYANLDECERRRSREAQPITYLTHKFIRRPE